MKKFRFALDRVLEWRRAQARIEELKLERLYAERNDLDASDGSLRDQRRQAEAELHSRGRGAGPGITGQDLRALNAFQHYTAAGHQRIAQARSRCEQQIALQMQILSGQRRQVKLLEKLKDQRRAEWSREEDREMDQQAEESHTSKLHLAKGNGERIL